MKIANGILSAAKALDSKVFVDQIGTEGLTIACRKRRVIFSQDDSSDSVFYIQKGRVKLTVVSPQGKEAVIGILGQPTFSVRGALPVSRFGRRRRAR